MADRPRGSAGGRGSGFALLLTLALAGPLHAAQECQHPGVATGWTLVTGSEPSIDALLKAFGVFTADKLDHPPTLLIGNDVTGKWIRAHGLASPDTLAELLVATVTDAASQAPPSESQRRGKHIYLTGESASGEIVALLSGGVEVPGAVLPCANCHGDGGRGSSEGGVIASDVTWATLTKPDGVTREDGRRRPPYTPELVARAITAGLDAGGNRLNPVMPRYRMSAADLSDLVAYLEVIGTLRDPGVPARR